jgi:prepilin-type N-terminal cleavage/methylation domain-containing protein
MRIQLQKRAGFTLVEIVIVVMIIGLIMAWGLPTFVQTFKRSPLQQAVHDMLEGCSAARAAAILSGKTTELVVANEDGHTTNVSVQGGGGFSASIPDSIGFEMLAVNFRNIIQEGGNEVHVRFFPNGTSDEFTAVMLEPTTGKRRTVQLDVVTGMAKLLTEEGMTKLR